MNMYKNLCTQYYELDKPTAPQEELDLYMQFCRPDASILEVMAGTGRFLLPLLAKGFDIEGVDASKDMLEVCRQKAAQRGLSVVLYEQFLHTMELPKTYDLIIIPAASFGLITDSMQIQESIRRLAAHMRHGGRLVVEVEPPANRPPALGQVTAAMRENSEGVQIILTTFPASYDSATQTGRSITKYEMVENGRLIETEYEDFAVRYHDRASFRERLQQEGFVVQAVIETEETLVFDCLLAEG